MELWITTRLTTEKLRDLQTATSGSRHFPRVLKPGPPLPSGAGVKTRHIILGKSRRRDASTRRDGCSATSSPENHGEGAYRGTRLRSRFSSGAIANRKNEKKLVFATESRPNQDISYSLVKDGFEIIPSVLTGMEVEALRASLSLMKVAPGHRKLMQRVPDITALAVSPKILGLLEGLLGAEPFPVRSIFFDKTPEANWLVPWHQDLSIAVKQRLDVPGYGPWSTKDGVQHVQPPVEILEALVTLRLHLDDCDESNGALRVIPNSHQLGRLNTARITEVRSQYAEIACSVRAGDALLMRPLLLHASSEASAPAHRRVIHLEYAACPLADGLEWAETSKTFFLKAAP